MAIVANTPNILLILLILSAFCILPAAANDANDIQTRNKNVRDHIAYQTKADKDNGCPEQIRCFGKNGKKDCDVDFSYGKPESHTFPRVHKWFQSTRVYAGEIIYFRVDINSIPASVLVSDGVKITTDKLNPLLAEIKTLTENLMNVWKGDNVCIDRLLFCGCLG